MDDLEVVEAERRLIPVLEGGTDEELDAGQGIADVVGDAGGKLSDRRELLGAENVPLMLLRLLGHRAYPDEHEIELGFQVAHRSARGQLHGRNVLVEVGTHVLKADGESGDGSAEASGDAVAADEPAQRSENAEEDHGRLRLGTHAFALDGGVFHRFLVDAQELLAGRGKVADRVAVGPLDELGSRVEALFRHRSSSAR